jgi:hypothetical protein
MNLKTIKKRYYILAGFILLLAGFFIWQATKKVQTEGDWQSALSRLSSADFNGDLVIVKNIRNFRYNGSEEEKDISVNYYDKTYDLSKLTKVWYIAEPFAGFHAAAHTFLSFEFEDGDFLSITIEARKLKGQNYSLLWGMLHTYPIMYIASDERDVVALRANIRKSNVYMYPVKLSKPENGRLLLIDILERMNDLAVHPDWYNTLWANCTSSIAYHVNRIAPGRLNPFSWQLALTGYADELALKDGLLDTNLNIDEARKKYYISDISRKIGDADNFSQLIRSGRDFDLIRN